MGRGGDSSTEMIAASSQFDGLNDFLYSDPVFALYSDTYSDGSWLQGGCWSLAEALRHILGGELVAVWDEGREVPDHIVCQVDANTYVDGDGASTRQELLHRWHSEEFLRAPYLVPFDPAVFAKVPADQAIPYSAELTGKVETALRDFFKIGQ